VLGPLSQSVFCDRSGSRSSHTLPYMAPHLIADVLVGRPSVEEGFGAVREIPWRFEAAKKRTTLSIWLQLNGSNDSCAFDPLFIFEYQPIIG